MNHCAYQATQEDVEAVLSSNTITSAFSATSIELIAQQVFANLDHQAIEDEALFGDSLDEQTDYANDCIARQLREMSVLMPLKPVTIKLRAHKSQKSPPPLTGTWRPMGPVPVSFYGDRTMTIDTNAAAQTNALLALKSALAQATDSGLFDEMAVATSHPDAINAFCDDVAEFEKATAAETKVSSSSFCRALVLNAGVFFANPRFIAWLNNDAPKFTWHTGGEPGDYSDVVVCVDPSLSGEGSDSDMPQEVWNEILRVCRMEFGPALGHHIMVRLVNKQ